MLAALLSNSQRQIRIAKWTLLLTLPWISLFSAAPVNAQNYRIAHCFLGCPVGSSTENHLVIRPIYALSYNTDYKSADWVAYKVNAGSIGIASSLSRAAQVDGFVEDTLEPSDFLGSEESGLLRSQYAPLVSFAGTPYWNDVNYLTNAVARTRNLSQGAWYGLDWAVRNLVNREDELAIVTGPIYLQTPVAPQLATNKDHRVPDGFFKIVVTSDGESAGFLFEQSTPVHVHHCDLQASIAQIEELTGLEFFPERQAQLSESLYSRLGCS